MTTEQELRDALPDEIPIDEQEKLVDGLLNSTGLAIDEGLEVVMTRVDGDRYDRSHPHPIDEDTLVLHLTPEDAREFDRGMGDLLARLIVDAATEDDNE